MHATALQATAGIIVTCYKQFQNLYGVLYIVKNHCKYVIGKMLYVKFLNLNQHFLAQSTKMVIKNLP